MSPSRYVRHQQQINMWRCAHASLSSYSSRSPCMFWAQNLLIENLCFFNNQQTTKNNCLRPQIACSCGLQQLFCAAFFTRYVFKMSCIYVHSEKHMVGDMKLIILLKLDFDRHYNTAVSDKYLRCIIFFSKQYILVEITSYSNRFQRSKFICVEMQLYCYRSALKEILKYLFLWNFANTSCHIT